MTLLQMTFSGSLLICVTALLRGLLLERLPRRTFSFLWLVATLRLLLPLSLPSPVSFYGLFQDSVPAMQSISTAPVTQTTAAATPVQPFPTLPAVTPPAGELTTPTVLPLAAPQIPLTAVLWLLGAAVTAFLFLRAYAMSCRTFRESLPVRTPFTDRWLMDHPLRRTLALRQSDRISSPLTYGIFRPVILLPKKTDWQDEQTLSYILTHEYCHICRFDALFKLLLVAAVCVHWFNPAAWLMLLLANRDIELCCDEAVLRTLSKRSKADYARTLLAMEEKKSGLGALYSSFSKNAIRERIRSIMAHKKPTLLLRLLAVVLVAAVVAFFATSAQKSDPLTNQARLSFDYIGKELALRSAAGDALEAATRQFDEELNSPNAVEKPLTVTDEEPNWLLLVNNNSANTMTISVITRSQFPKRSQDFYVEPGTMLPIYSTSPWTAGDYSLRFSVDSGTPVQGVVTLYTSAQPILPEQGAEVSLTQPPISIPLPQPYRLCLSDTFRNQPERSRYWIEPKGEILDEENALGGWECFSAGWLDMAEIGFGWLEFDDNNTPILLGKNHCVTYDMAERGYGWFGQTECTLYSDKTYQELRKTHPDLEQKRNFWCIVRWGEDGNTFYFLYLAQDIFSRESAERIGAGMSFAPTNPVYSPDSSLRDRLSEYAAYDLTYDETTGLFFYRGHTQVTCLMDDTDSETGYCAFANGGNATVRLLRDESGAITSCQVWTGDTLWLEDTNCYLTLNQQSGNFVLNLNGNAEGPLLTGRAAYDRKNHRLTAKSENGTIEFLTEGNDFLYQRSGSTVQTYKDQGQSHALQDGAVFTRHEEYTTDWIEVENGSIDLIGQLTAQLEFMPKETFAAAKGVITLEVHQPTNGLVINLYDATDGKIVASFDVNESTTTLQAENLNSAHLYQIGLTAAEDTKFGVTVSGKDNR